MRGSRRHHGSGRSCCVRRAAPQLAFMQLPCPPRLLQPISGASLGQQARAPGSSDSEGREAAAAMDSASATVQDFAKNSIRCVGRAHRRAEGGARGGPRSTCPPPSAPGPRPSGPCARCRAPQAGQAVPEARSGELQSAGAPPAWQRGCGRKRSSRMAAGSGQRAGGGRRRRPATDLRLLPPAAGSWAGLPCSLAQPRPRPAGCSRPARGTSTTPRRRCRQLLGSQATLAAAARPLCTSAALHPCRKNSPRWPS